MSFPRESKPGTISFSDQISSRLHRWVHKTTSRTRDLTDTQQNIKKVNQDNKHVNDMDIKKPDRLHSEASSPDSRTILELEKALKDLINNCVTNTTTIAGETNSGVTSTAVGHDVVQEDDTKSLQGTNTAIDNGCELGQGEENEYSLRVSKITDKLCMTTLNLKEKGSLQLQCGSKQTTGFKPDVENETSTSKDSQISPTFRADEVNYRDMKVDHSSKNTETFELNISTNNVNRGLSTGNSMKKRIHRVSKTPWSNVLHHSRSKTKEKRIAKPPLRRIQSEGDVIAQRFTFQDSDVDAFAETCIRHAQKKRLSEVGSIEGDFDNLSVRSCGEIGIEVPALKNEECNIVLREKPDLSNNMSQPDLDDILPIPGHQHSTRDSHTSLRPGSLSLPLNIKQSENPSKNPVLKTRTPRSLPSSPKHVNVSPKFRKFPCQPVFYVPEQNDVTSSRDITRRRRGQSVTDDKQSEHLI